MNGRNKGKPKLGFGFLMGLLSLILILGLVGELSPARGMELASGLIPDAIDDKYFFPATGNLTVAAPGVLTNDTDPENDTLSAVAATNADTAQGGKYTLYADGSLFIPSHIPLLLGRISSSTVFMTAPVTAH